MRYCVSMLYFHSIHAFQLDGKGWDDMASEDFLAKYVPHAQGHLSLHHDHSNITALVTLSNFEEYEGGGTYFSHQKKLIKEKQGYVSIHHIILLTSMVQEQPQRNSLHYSFFYEKYRFYEVILSFYNFFLTKWV